MADAVAATARRLPLLRPLLKHLLEPSPVEQLPSAEEAQACATAAAADDPVAAALPAIATVPSDVHTPARPTAAAEPAGTSPPARPAGRKRVYVGGDGSAFRRVRQCTPVATSAVTTRAGAWRSGHGSVGGAMTFRSTDGPINMAAAAGVGIDPTAATGRPEGQGAIRHASGLRCNIRRRGDGQPEVDLWRDDGMHGVEQRPVPPLHALDRAVLGEPYIPSLPPAAHSMQLKACHGSEAGMPGITQTAHGGTVRLDAPSVQAPGVQIVGEGGRGSGGSVAAVADGWALCRSSNGGAGGDGRDPSAAAQAPQEPPAASDAHVAGGRDARGACAAAPQQRAISAVEGGLAADRGMPGSAAVRDLAVAAALADWGLNAEVIRWLQVHSPNTVLPASPRLRVSAAFRGERRTCLTVSDVVYCLQAQLPKRTVGDGCQEETEWLLEDIVALLADPHLLRSGYSFRDASRTNIELVLALYHQHNLPAAAVPATPAQPALAAASHAGSGAPSSDGDEGVCASGAVAAAVSAADHIVAAAAACSVAQHGPASPMTQHAHRMEFMKQLHAALPPALLMRASAERRQDSGVGGGLLSAGPPERGVDAEGNSNRCGRFAPPQLAQHAAAAGEVAGQVTPQLPRDGSIGHGSGIADTGSGVTDGRVKAEGQSVLSTSPRFS